MLGATFGRPEEWPSQDLIGYSEEFGAGLALEAYACGVFPMPIYHDGDEMGWWSPMQRGLLPIRGLHVTRSVRKSAKRYTTTVDQAFGGVLEACADPSRDGGWIDARIEEAYTTLHEKGWVHSVETWDADGRLVGGLYGVHIGGVFAGESMFHHPELGRDASKVALLRLAVELADAGVALLDVQWLTEHLGSLGAYEVPRHEYLGRLSLALELPRLPWRAREAMDGTELLKAWDVVRSAGTLSVRGGADA
ncbi:leucyl/phenylalanyl-tRNA--protein transferase [Tessaracoccus sp. MC1627]|uniref:leucyl/phenylalanyl-tRNA--protein transferase n=1 Tax=Tessaracoccus sp. MC1627 TaxID=2760312 RepID=UPI0015FF5887|nr:leucyl/phenylalanyl-tRNA--protein transferase [Tessaracoccus sp. MC1627]MBB1511499.1 leucyl/phenylalanyl-tRNA--protein transferase [Tessaracoccus sp. MC1627]